MLRLLLKLSPLQSVFVLRCVMLIERVLDLVVASLCAFILAKSTQTGHPPNGGLNISFLDTNALFIARFYGKIRCEKHVGET